MDLNKTGNQIQAKNNQNPPNIIHAKFNMITVVKLVWRSTPESVCKFQPN